MYLQIKRAFMALCLSLTCMITFAQREVTGSVTDPMGKPLIGVSVVVDGTSIGSVTDINGNFTISRVPNDATLRLSYIGYREQKLPLGSQSNYYITMHEDNQNLDELVVIGYQTVKKRDVTGAVSSLKAEDLKGVASANGLIALQTAIPGMDVTQSSGEAGSGVSIQLRGARSLAASNSPLIMVDGVEYGSTLDINPADIESVDVLKDASSAAIYGTRGANGVILITTKRGQAGKTHVTFDAYNSWNTATSYPKTLYGDAEEKYRQEKADYATNYATYLSTGTWGTQVSTPEQVIGTKALEDGTLCLDIYNDKSYTNWTDYFMRNNTSQNYVVGVNGGSERTNFSISLGLMNDRGLMNNDELQRYNGKVNIDHKVNDYFKFGGSLLFTYKDQDKANSGIYNQYLKMTTITHPYLNYTDGTTKINTYPNPWYSSHCSPLLDEVEGAYQHNIETTRFFGNVYAEINVIKGFKYRSQFSADRSNSRDGLYQDYESIGRIQNTGTSYISNAKSNQTNVTWDNTLNYETDFGGSRNSLNVLLGHEMWQKVYEMSSVYGAAGKTHYYESSFYNTEKITTKETSNGYIKQSLMSFFGRVNYNYAEKYLFTASLRADGSSVLAEGHKWGYFPSFAAAWRITEEPWMLLASSWLSNLKLRASWGLTGNAAVDPYSTQATLSSQLYYYASLDGQMTNISGNIPSSMANPNLTWEKTSTFDLGVDFGFANGRVNGTIDFYLSRTRDLLSNKVAPASSVFTTVLSNVGKTKGSGIEFSLSADAIRTPDFDWNVNFNYAHSTDEITELSEGVSSYKDSNTKYIVKGQRINTYYDYKADNTWAVGEYATYLASWKSRHPGETASYAANYGDPGTPKIIDVNDDGTINEKDRVIYNMDPDHIFGLTNTITYKGFSLSFQAFASIGGYVRYLLSDAVNFEDANWADVDYWTVDNQHAKFPSPGLTSAQQTWYTQYKTALEYEKASYFKIKDITFAYNFPKKLISRFSMTNLRVYGSLKNYITISGIDNYDPERGGAVTFPLQKQVVLGLNVEF